MNSAEYNSGDPEGDIAVRDLFVRGIIEMYKKDPDTNHLNDFRLNVSSLFRRIGWGMLCYKKELVFKIFKDISTLEMGYFQKGEVIQFFDILYLTYRSPYEFDGDEKNLRDDPIPFDLNDIPDVYSRLREKYEEEYNREPAEYAILLGLDFYGDIKNAELIHDLVCYDELPEVIDLSKTFGDTGKNVFHTEYCVDLLQYAKDPSVLKKRDNSGKRPIDYLTDPEDIKYFNEVLEELEN